MFVVVFCLFSRLDFFVVLLFGGLSGVLFGFFPLDMLWTTKASSQKSKNVFRSLARVASVLMISSLVQ